jgi:hypothetical protein
VLRLFFLNFFDQASRHLNLKSTPPQHTVFGR